MLHEHNHMCTAVFTTPTTATSLHGYQRCLAFLTSEQVLEMATSCSVSYSTAVFTRTFQHTDHFAMFVFECRVSIFLLI